MLQSPWYQGPTDGNMRRAGQQRQMWQEESYTSGLLLPPRLSLLPLGAPGLACSALPVELARSHGSPQKLPVEARRLASLRGLALTYFTADPWATGPSRHRAVTLKLTHQ